MELLFTATTPAGARRDVEVVVDDGAATGDLADALADALGWPGRPAALSCERLGGAVPASLRLGSAGLLDGDVVSVGQRVGDDDERVIESRGRGDVAGYLVVRRGRGLGRWHELRRGVVVVGRATDADIVLDDPTVSRRHLELTIDATVEGRSLSSSNAVYVDEELLDGTRVIEPASVVRLGAVEVVFVQANTGWDGVRCRSDRLQPAASPHERAGPAGDRPPGGTRQGATPTHPVHLRAAPAVRVGRAGVGAAVAHLLVLRVPLARFHRGELSGGPGVGPLRAASRIEGVALRRAPHRRRSRSPASRRGGHVPARGTRSRRHRAGHRGAHADAVGACTGRPRLPGAPPRRGVVAVVDTARHPRHRGSGARRRGGVAAGRARNGPRRPVGGAVGRRGRARPGRAERRHDGAGARARRAGRHLAQSGRAHDRRARRRPLAA